MLLLDFQSRFYQNPCSKVEQKQSQSLPYPTHLILRPHVHGDVSLYSVDINQLNTQTTPSTLTAKPLNLQEPFLSILGSSNGLVLAKPTAIEEKRELVVYLVNPTTKKTLKLPVKRRTDTYGFGYDYSTDDYKVISLPRSDFDTEFVRVYSLRNNSWRNLRNPPNQLHDYCSPHSGVFFNNNLHFIVGGGHLRIAIAAFNLTDEEFHIIKFPKSIKFAYNSCVQLFALGEKLAAITCVWLPGHAFVNELWVMEEYGVRESWEKLCIFQIGDEVTMGMMKHYLNSIVPDYEFYAKVGNQDMLVGNSDVDKIYTYNIDERRCTSVSFEGCHEDFIVIGTYVESLESPERFC
ncbi:F-box/kelch-repeat protein At3g06240-like [Rutidosis leptorrhynchoides]|uniref:F-box/kelch-repeat protein At3g06240-like n=1 Tax=Rutidosis leptorrhynchoides TaxID=125765 RepID=UPI003A995DF9